MVAKILPMICNYSLWNPKPFNDMIIEKQCSYLSCVVECRHRFGPLGKVVYCDNNITMPPKRTRVIGHEANSPFPKCSYRDNKMHWRWKFVDFTIIYLARMTNFDHEDAVVKYSRPKLTNIEYLLCGRVSRQVSTTSPNMKII